MSSITHDQQKRPSLFGPILLIAIGFFFLFNRLNPVTDLYWVDVLRLWPLFLILAGVNILVKQAPRPFGMLGSAVVGLVAVVLIGFVLIGGLPEGLFGSSSLEGWQTKEISFSAEEVNGATMDLDIGPPGADIYALEDSLDLIAGTVTYQSGLQFDKVGSGGDVNVTLAPRNNSGWFWEPGHWNELQEEARWEIGLNQSVPIRLNLDASAGSSELDLRDVNLTALNLNVSAGEMTVFLPNGNYDAELNTNAGETTLTLPVSGRQKFEVEVNAGALTILLPEGTALRVLVNQSLGSFNVQDNLLIQVEDGEIWQTPGFEESEDQIELVLDISLGSVNIR